jgi:S-adenosylmethionine:tRNA ribosyltransferase-isomerase
MSTSTVNFEIPGELNAVSPPERRGVRRDHVRLMVLDRKTGEAKHDIFYRLDQYLQPGDVIILNNSRTIPAVFHGRSVTSGDAVEIRLARQIQDPFWEMLIIGNENSVGDQLILSNNLSITVKSRKSGTPFFIGKFSLKGIEMWDAIYKVGEPVRYEYIHDPWPLSDYQTVYGSVPGSVEMASAGRAFSWEMLAKLKRKGIEIGFLQLHTGLSYLLDDKWHIGPAENIETYVIPKETMQQVLKAKAEKRRVIAVGTTVVRTLETVGLKGDWTELEGKTNLHVDKDFDLKIVDGLITGLHEPQASHLDLLTAFIPEKLLEKAYNQAIKERYLWHEFGDINLIL